MKFKQYSKKGKYSFHKIPLKAFHSSVHLYISKDINKLNRKLNLVSGDLTNYDGCVTTDYEEGRIIMILKPDAGVNTITHETNHFINGLFAYIGQKPDLENDEVESYLKGYIAGMISKCILKHKRKLKSKLKSK